MRLNKPSAVSHQPSAISGQLSTVSYQRSAISGQLSAISGLRVCTVGIVCLIMLLALALPIHAQDITSHITEVYLENDVSADGADRLLFVDVLTGVTTSAQVYGERYTPLADRVLFFDPINRSVMTVNTAGSVTPHTFIQLGQARRVDWIISSDQRLIAWTLTYDDPAGMRTMTSIASPDGANQRELWVDGPRSDGLRALPVAFSVDNNVLIMDFQPDIISGFAPYSQYGGLFRLALEDGSIAPLPDDESPCFCGAALRAGQLLRLSVTGDLAGFDVLVFDLASGRSSRIAATRLTNFNQAGNILIAPDGNRAVYALSQIPNFREEPDNVRTVLILVNLDNMTQQPLTDPITRYLNPIGWTEDNTAILFTSPEQAGTWKLSIADGTLTRVAQATYIGLLHS